MRDGIVLLRHAVWVPERVDGGALVNAYAKDTSSLGVYMRDDARKEFSSSLLSPSLLLPFFLP